MMTNLMVQAATQIQGTIEQLNRGGIKVGGTWYNYPKGHAGERIPREFVGAFIVLTALSMEGKSYIGSILRLDRPKASAGAAPSNVESKSPEMPTPASPPPAPVETKPAAPVASAAAPGTSSATPAAVEAGGWTKEPATDGQKKKIEDLSKALDLEESTVQLILKLRFKEANKTVANLTKGEASKLITFLDNEAPLLPPKRRPS